MEKPPERRGHVEDVLAREALRLRDNPTTACRGGSPRGRRAPGVTWNVLDERIREERKVNCDAESQRLNIH